MYVITFLMNRRLIGPFKTVGDADKYGKKEFSASGNFDWCIAPIKPPCK